MSEKVVNIQHERDAVLAGYTRLAPDQGCQCMQVWTDSDGSQWCCGGDVSKRFKRTPRYSVDALNPSNIVSLPLAPTDAEIAASLRDRFRAALQPIASLMQEAHSHKMRFDWSIAPNPWGQFTVGQVNVLKLMAGD